MKCQRCGNDEVWQEGHKVAEAQGADATQSLTYRRLAAKVCDGCADMLRRLGWK